ncbi:hypothetical protein JTB14_003706 [Gonioctena quinquepunctata]|nr:hypothetical protein JTB14_003706 [Gonioctena quinquepunctata]
MQAFQGGGISGDQSMCGDYRFNQLEKPNHFVGRQEKMVFVIKDKVALITGGASGLGLQYAKQLLRNGLKGVTLADLNPKLGIEALDQIKQEFGHNKAIFVKTDVTQIDSLEDLSSTTTKHNSTAKVYVPCSNDNMEIFLRLIGFHRITNVRICRTVMSGGCKINVKAVTKSKTML